MDIFHFNMYSVILFFFFFLSTTLPLISYGASIPALYVFGDSLLDSGNNKHLPLKYKADYLPYGIDFEGGNPTGRNTNGKTVADFLAEHMGLPKVPAYLDLKEVDRNRIATGINYASGGSGILPDTNNETSFILDKQIEFFQSTVENNLPKIFKDEIKLKTHLSESVFVFNTGVNDMFHNGTFRGTNKFSVYLLKEFSIRLQRLYNLGARKFVVNNIPPAGCFPSKAINTKPRGQCDEKINKRISFYNKKLSHLLGDLQSKLHGFHFSYADLYWHLTELRENAEKYGIAETWKPCCPQDIYGDLICHPNSEFCADRDTYLFFDVHPTQIANQLYLTRCINGDICSPFSSLEDA